MQTESPGGRTEKRAWGNDCSLLQCEQVWAEVDEATQLHKLVQLCPSAHPQPGRAKPQQEGLWHHDAPALVGAHTKFWQIIFQ